MRLVKAVEVFEMPFLGMLELSLWRRLVPGAAIRKMVKKTS